MLVQVVIGQAKSIEIPQSFNATVFTVAIRQKTLLLFSPYVSCQKVSVMPVSSTLRRVQTALSTQ